MDGRGSIVTALAVRLAVRTAVQIDVLDGRRAWQHQQSPGMFRMSYETTDLDERATAELREQFHALDLLRMATIDEKARLAAVEDIQIDGRPAAGVLIKDDKSPAMKLYFDRQSGLLVKKEQQDMLLDRKIEMHQEVFYQDYLEQDGLQHPRRMLSKRDGRVSARVELVSLDLSPDVDEKLFANPRRRVYVGTDEQASTDSLRALGELPHLKTLRSTGDVSLDDDQLRAIAGLKIACLCLGFAAHGLRARSLAGHGTQTRHQR